MVGCIKQIIRSILSDFIREKTINKEMKKTRGQLTEVVGSLEGLLEGDVNGLVVGCGSVGLVVGCRKRKSTIRLRVYSWQAAK